MRWSTVVVSIACDLSSKELRLCVHAGGVALVSRSDGVCVVVCSQTMRTSWTTLSMRHRTRVCVRLQDEVARSGRPARKICLSALDPWSWSSFEATGLVQEALADWSFAFGLPANHSRTSRLALQSWDYARGSRLPE